MNIIERGRVFVQKLQEFGAADGVGLATVPAVWGDLDDQERGRRNYPYFFGGRQEVRIQRHECHGCGAFYDEEYAFLVRGSWYAREVHRYAVDGWVHLRSSLRRIAETVRSWIGHQERWWLWHPWEKRPEGQGGCRFHHSTVQRWVDRAGKKAQESVAGQLRGLSSSGQMGTDGLWVRLRGGGKRVLLTLVDSVTGLIWGMVVVGGEETAASWQKLFERAQEMGLLLEQMSGLTSDGAQGLLSYLRGALSWVHHQRCIPQLLLGRYVWRNLAGDLAKAVG